MPSGEKTSMAIDQSDVILRYFGKKGGRGCIDHEGRLIRHSTFDIDYPRRAYCNSWVDTSRESIDPRARGPAVKKKIAIRHSRVEKYLPRYLPLIETDLKEQIRLDLRETL